MNKTNRQGPDLENLLKRKLKDDLPSEAEARMNRQFLRLKRTLDRTKQLPDPGGWTWMRGPFRKGIIAVASAAMIILGLAMQLGGPQSALAHSIEQLKVIITISVGLNRTSSMDCTVLKAGDESEPASYRIRWRADGDVRVDAYSAEGTQALWISKETVSITGPGSGDVCSTSMNSIASGTVWLPALEFLSPEILAEHLAGHYGLMQSSGRTDSGANEFLIVGREGRQDVEITVDSETYLPKVLKKYSRDSDTKNGVRDSMTEVRFRWNQSIPHDLFVPGPPAGSQ